MKMALLLLYCAVFILATAPFGCYGEEDKASLIPIGSHSIVVEFSKDTELLCAKPDDKEIEWVLPSGQTASKNITSDRLTQIDSSLRIQNTTWNDTGIYTCRVHDNIGHNDTVLLKVYEMPSYFTEGIVILSINCGLILLFFICLGLSFCKRKKLRKAEKHSRTEFNKSLHSNS